MQGCHAGVGHVVDNIAPLLLQRGRDREHAFGEPTAGGTVRAETALAPQDRGPERALRGVVGRVDPGDIDEGPEGRRELHQIATRRRRLAVRDGNQ